MPTKKKSPSKNGKTRTTERGPALTRASTAALHAEIERRLRALETKRKSLSAELDALDHEIATCAGATATALLGGNGTAGSRGAGGIAGSGGAGRPRKRPRNETNLAEALKKLLKRRTMSVSEMAIAVQQAGYRTSSPNFRTIVNQTLINNKRDFKRVARGRYTAK